ncbi:hypothetical protein HXX01_00185 [Candidatus Nomurabacteria bacterium]|nr:hypothetical protein [Candidatus Nomurabacteria bacterium]
MKKQLTKNIIFSSIIFSLVFASVFSSTSTSAASKVGWENPAKNGNPYKIQLTDTFNGQMLADVVSCTGLIDGAIKTVTTFASDQIRNLVIKKLKKNKTKVCEQVKKGIISGVAAAANLSLTDIAKEIKCNADPNPKGVGDATVSDPTTQEKLDDLAKQKAKEDKRKDCLNGIATKLAKDQLAVMTKYTMNWVNSGFNGDPMYVRNIDSFMNNMTNDIVTQELGTFQRSPQYYPYGRAYARSMFLGNISLNNFEDSMKQSLTNYLDSGRLGGDTADFLSHGDYMNRYANDFSLGGWSGWLALTQKSQNNPLGFQMETSQYIAAKQNKQVENTKAELARNNGMFDQKTCVSYGITGGAADTKATQQKAQADLANKLKIREVLASQLQSCGALQTEQCESVTNPVTKITSKTNCKMVNNTKCATLSGQLAEATSEYQTLADAYAKTYQETNGAVKGEAFKDCKKWETVTPGSVILSKVNTYLNSEVKQMELANGVNSFLAGIFDSLVTVLRNEGLSSLSSFDSKGGDSYNSPILEVDPNTGQVMTSSGYTDKSVDLTKDLGNTFVHEDLIDMGDWDAQNNVPKLSPNIGPYNPLSQNIISNAFYTVTKAGNSQIILEGYNGWAVGDRAFFNGSTWQNWKKGSPSPIKKAGILQIQKDYIVAAKEMLSITPNVMPAIGELDYCIPGPNPGWQANTGDASDAFTEFSSALTTDYTPAGGFLGKRAYVDVVAPDVESAEYTKYKSIFDKSSNDMWLSVVDTYPFLSIMLAPKIQNGWKGKSYGGYDRKEQAIGLVTDIKDKISNDLALFQTQYEAAINNLYGPNSPMQKEYIENEATYDLTPNPAYLKMSQEGLNITKDIVSYDEKIKALDSQYRSDIIDANTNIKKLELIKDRVSAIILAAQKRRNDNRAEIIKKYNETNDTKITEADYYKCAKEENVAFYEDTDIFTTLKGGEERCTDGIDNDLNGLVDSADPACAGFDKCAVGSTDPSCPKESFDDINVNTNPDVTYESGSDPTNEVMEPQYNTQ